MVYDRPNVNESSSAASVVRSPVSFACSVIEELNRNQDLWFDRSKFGGFVVAIRHRRGFANVSKLIHPFT